MSQRRKIISPGRFFFNFFLFSRRDEIKSTRAWWAKLDKEPRGISCDSARNVDLLFGAKEEKKIKKEKKEIKKNY